MSAENTNAWHLDKKVPIGLIATVIVQTSTIVWWARGMEARLSAVERDQTRQEKRDAEQDADNRAALAQVLARFDRFEAKMDRFIERVQERPLK